MSVPPKQPRRPRIPHSLPPPEHVKMDRFPVATSALATWDGYFLYQEARVTDKYTAYSLITLEQSITFTVDKGGKTRISKLPAGTRFDDCIYLPTSRSFNFFLKGKTDVYVVQQCPCCDGLATD